MNIFTIILTQPLANGLILFYKVLGENMGFAIIGFSLFLRLIMTPLTKPYIDSMKKMREFEPQLTKIKKKHKGDQKKLMQAQNEFYKQKGINPGAGCIPMIIQIVVLLVFVNVFTRALDASDITKFNDLLYAPLKLATGTSIHTQFLYLNIVKPDTLQEQFAILKSSLSAIPFGIPGPILILAALVQMISAKMTMPFVEVEKKIAKKTEEKSDDMMVAMQSSAIYTFPLMTILAGVRFPSGLALYWLLFSVYQAIQQYLTTGWGGLTPWLRKLKLLQ